MTFFTFNQGVSKTLEMLTGFPNFRIHNNCCINSDHIIARLNKLLPPQLLDIILKLNTKRTVIP